MTRSALRDASLPQSPAPTAHDVGIEGCCDALTFASRLCAGALVTLGSVVLAGWRLKVQWLMSVATGHASMKPNTAAGFVAFGLALAFASRRSVAGDGWSWVTVGRRCMAVLAGTCGALSLCEYAFHVNLHIDELLFADPVPSAFPGRMAYITATNFCLAGLALWMMDGGRIARRMVPWAALVVVADAYAGIVGYLYGVPVFYGALGYTAMAFHTGMGFLVLGLGILMAQRDSGLIQMLCAREPGSWLARRLLPVVIIVPVVLGWVYLHPAVSFGHPRFAMALFAVTLVGASNVTLWFVASFLNRAERERREIAQVREQSAAAVKQSERELRLVTDCLPLLLSYIDTQGRFQRVNRTYEDWLGLRSEDIVGRTVAELLGEAYWARVQPLRDKAMFGESATLETIYPTVRGDRRAQVTYAPDVDAEGLVRGVACMVVDMEDHRLAESALRQSEKLAVVGRLASSISHEINNPLEAVTNLLYLIEQETASDDASHGYVVQAQQELARVTNIVVQTLRFHRQATHPTVCHLSSLAEQVLGLYGGKLMNAQVAAELRFRENDAVLCREGEVRQVLANLVGNAIDAMGRGGRLVVRTSATMNRRTGQEGVAITIADTGQGMAAGVLPTLFQPFHTTKGAKGSGLGLWISKEIVDRHEGTLRVRSSRVAGASGTVFRVFFPHTA